MGFDITIVSVLFIDALEEYPEFFDFLESLNRQSRENLKVIFQREAYHGADEINIDYSHKIIDAFVKLKKMDKRSEYIAVGGLVPGLPKFIHGFKSYMNGC